MSDNVETLSSEDWTVTQDRVELPPSRGLSPWKFTVAVVRRLWRWLTSMRTALMLLFLLAIAAIPGSLLPQQNTNPEDVTAYYAAHPKLAPIVSDLSGFGVFGSPWFSAIYLLLFISLVGCLVPRLKVYFQAVRRVPPDAPSRLTRMPVNATDLAFDLPVAEAAASVRSLLRSRRYRTVVRSHDDGTITVSGEKGYLKEAGNLLFHFSLMALLIGVAYGSWYGWHGDRLLVSGTSFCSTPAEFNDYSPGARVTPARLEPFCVTLNSFDAAYTSQGEPQLYRANATYTEGSSTDAKPANIEVNAPLRLPHANVYLIGHGYAPIVKFTDKYGKSETITEPYLTEDGNDTSQGVDTFPDLNINPLTGTNVDPKTYQKDQIGFAGVFVPTAADGLATSVFPAENNPLLVLTPYQGDLGLDNGAPLSVYSLDQAQINSGALKATGDPLRLKPGESAKLPDGSTVQFLGTKQWASLAIRYDPGEKLVLVGALLLVIGLVGSLTGRRRRVWFRLRPSSHGSSGEAGGLARAEYASFPTEFDSIVTAAGADSRPERDAHGDTLP
ncbi:MAG TPA: cytochrome c biogenesis protein ResB [Micromonosporaceae bacterium]